MNYEELVEKLAYEIIEDSMSEELEEDIEVTAEEVDAYIWEKIAEAQEDNNVDTAIVEIAKENGLDPNKLTEEQVSAIMQHIQKQQGAQEKAAEYYQEAQLMKQAAEETFAEAGIIEDAALTVLAEFGII